VFTQDADDYLEAMAIRNKMYENWLEEPKMPVKPFDVLAHQIVGITMDLRGADPEFIYRLVKRAYPFKDLSREEFQETLTLLKDIYITFDYENKIVRSKKGLLYYFNNVSMIPDEKQFIVMDKELNKRVGILHQGFVVQKGAIGSKFIMQGETWRITDVKGEMIEVIRDPHAEGAIPSWEGELIPVSYDIAKEAASYRPKYSFLFKGFENQKIIPDEKNILIEQYKDHIVMHSCFGTKVNETLSKVLGALITTRVGSSVGIKTDPYRIIFKLPKGKGFKITKEVFDMSPEWIEFIIKTSIKNSSLYMYRFYQIAKRFGIINKDAEFSQARVKRLMSIFNNTIVSDEVMSELRREKLDLGQTEEVIKKINSKEIKVHFSEILSPLGLLSIEQGTFSSFIKPEEAYAEIFSMIDKRLKGKKFFFACTNCKKNVASFRVKSVPKNLKCPFCSAKTIGFEKEYKRGEILKLLKKKELNKDEKKMLEDFEKTAELFLNYGNDAVYVLAAYGIGPVVGGRILSKGYKTKEDLIFAIVKEERKFIRTKRFW
jgi:ATP-dependent Lhr-like helicase